MNERIRELIAEADRKCSETRGIYDEILAELIVQDCLNICEEMGENGKDGHYCADAIVKLFKCV
jgi:hypothetical protein